MNKPAADILVALPSAPGAAGGESAGYLNQGSDQLYYVRHEAQGRRIGQVLMAGPFGAENEPLYIPWVRWARYLAARGLDVLRFDYRGVGESTGDFSLMDMAEWLSDVRLCCQHLARDDVPLVLHGLGLGALLASRAFSEGVGDGLLAWSPPPTGREILQYTLRRQMSVGYGRRTASSAMTRQECIRALEAGESVMIDGYVWAARLWRGSQAFRFIDPADDDTRLIGGARRPSRVVHLDQGAGPLFLPWGDMPGPRCVVEHLNPDLSATFQESCAWICQAVTQSARIHARDLAH